MAEGYKKIKAEYLISLNYAEANTLRDILWHVGGTMKTRRKHASAISDALDKALGIEPDNWESPSDITEDSEVTFVEI